MTDLPDFAALIRESKKTDDSLPPAEMRRIKSWMSKYASIMYYCKVRDSCYVPANVVHHGINMRNWVERQRRAMIKGELNARQVRLFESARFVGDPPNTREMQYLRQWQETFTELKESFERDGFQCLDTKYVSDKGGRIGVWLRNQHSSFKKLDPARQKQLIELGLDPDVRKRHSTIIPWDVYYAELKKYAQQHGHAAVPLQHVTDSGIHLGNWVRRQRGKYADTPRLMREKLDALGFVWDSRDTRWSHMAGALRLFVEEYGHAFVPVEYTNTTGETLGAWLEAQHKSRDALSPSRYAELAALGVPWAQHSRYGATVKQVAPVPRRQIAARDTKTLPWAEGYAVLRRFREVHGHTDVPRDFVASNGVPLGLWVHVQQEKHSRGELSGAHRSMLEIVGAIQRD